MRRDAVQVVGGEHDRETVGVEVGEEVQHLVAGAHVDPGRGFVQQQHLRPAEQRPRDEHPLLLAAGELADVAISEAADAELLEHRVHFLPLVTRRPGQDAPSGPRHQHDLGDGDREVPVDRPDLRHVAERDAARDA